MGRVSGDSLKSSQMSAHYWTRDRWPEGLGGVPQGGVEVGRRVEAVLLMLLSVLTSFGVATAAASPSSTVPPCIPSGDPATSEVLDDFEYADSPFNHGWAKEQWFPATFNTTSDRFVHGRCSLLVGEGGDNMNIVRGVNLSQDYRLSAWFYDSLYSPTTEYGVLLSILDSNHQWDRGLGLSWWNSNFYIYSEVNQGGPPYLHSTSIARTVGWHNASFERVGTTLNRSIDGVLVNSLAILPGESENQIRLATHAIYSSTYWDYVTFVTLEVSVVANPSTGVAPLAVSLSSTVTGGTPPYTYAWTFGDGGSSSLASPSHSYLAAGTYIASLTVTDSLANQKSVSASVTVIAVLVATGSSDVSDGPVPLAVSFSVSASGGTGPFSYNWDFGDGSTSTDQNPIHTFKQPGSYTVKVEVRDSSGQTKSMTFQIVARENVSPSGLPMLPIVAIAVALVAVAAIASWLVLRRRKAPPPP